MKPRERQENSFRARKVRAAVLMALMFCSQAGSQSPRTVPTIKENLSFARNEYFAKGGIGIITKALCVDLKSANNELVFDGGHRWSGRSKMTPEVLIVFGKKAFSPGALPPNFDLSKAIVVSFEGVRVRFFDFSKMSGGYYRRTGNQ